MPKIPTKLRWKDPEGRELYAGGVVIVDCVGGELGIWCIEEMIKGRIVFSDIGGRYDYNDCDIFGTIVREFREELYNQAEINYRTIKKFPREKFIYIDGYGGKPVYMCIVASAADLGLKNVLYKLSIPEVRNAVFEGNPNIPRELYRTFDFRFIQFKDIKKGSVLIGKRLTEILKKSEIMKKN